MVDELETEITRDASVNRGSWLTGNTPLPVEKPKQAKAPDVSESGIPKILRTLRWLTGFVPPKKPSNPEEQKG